MCLFLIQQKGRFLRCVMMIKELSHLCYSIIYIIYNTVTDWQSNLHTAKIDTWTSPQFSTLLSLLCDVPVSWWLYVLIQYCLPKNGTKKDFISALWRFVEILLFFFWTCPLWYMGMLRNGMPHNTHTHNNCAPFVTAKTIYSLLIRV